MKRFLSWFVGGILGYSRFIQAKLLYFPVMVVWEDA
jgi:hypothetical protein